MHCKTIAQDRGLTSLDYSASPAWRSPSQCRSALAIAVVPRPAFHFSYLRASDRGLAASEMALDLALAMPSSDARRAGSS
jgi:hypothetical protein